MTSTQDNDQAYNMTEQSIQQHQVAFQSIFRLRVQAGPQETPAATVLSTANAVMRIISARQQEVQLLTIHILASRITETHLFNIRQGS